MRKLFLPLLAICFLLAGCSLLDGTYHSVSPHHPNSEYENSFVEAVGDDLQLRNALSGMVSQGAKNKIITVANFQEQQLLESMSKAVDYIKTAHPIGAYAVDDITYEVGSVGGTTGVSVQISYRHGKGDILKIRHAENMDEARLLIEQALVDVDPGLVLLVHDYQKEDIVQLVDDYAAAHPSAVMEVPAIEEQIYPDSGAERVWELNFVYQTPRDSLRDMQETVARVFDSAALYVTQNATESRKYSQLYGFLMERFQSYQIKSSLTPAYSLLSYGVGDSFTIASVYAEMCKRAGLECLVVTGTLAGQPHHWNIVRQSGHYYHVDLLNCQSYGYYRIKIDIQMTDYVWDYSAYPRCLGNPLFYIADPEEPTEPVLPEDPTEPEMPTNPPTPPTEPPEPPTEPPEDPTIPPELPTEPPEPPTEPQIPPATEPDPPPQTQPPVPPDVGPEGQPETP